MRYAEFPAPEALAPYVHCLWVFEGPATGEAQRIAPDGRSELIFHWRTPYLERVGGDWRPQPGMLFAGQLTRPLHLLAREPAGVVGVRFRTSGAPAYLRSHANPFTDKRIAIGDPPDLGGAPDEAARLALVAAHVEARIDARFHDRAIAVVVARLRESDGRLSQAELCETARLSPRVLQRRFVNAVGVPPRMLASIVRFRRVFEALEAPKVASWTDAAQAAGYFDHPKMARDFRRFLGCTPGEFVKADRGLATSLAAA
ncbi:MAG: AraC family transcriptional regulator [Phenylobacterium sp.]|uniref:helix-turn-helix domain-containing protein n=1 Tax=Phenylobacterium sp. TaxID=1871053 RepID=UPI001A3FD1A5|nr:helix-turn-helix domain-containing protein [Phenylobacterium sp.]MBL8553817.1 AraC family transcriptional regulator [Phenylobacterium sp.]